MASPPLTPPPGSASTLPALLRERAAETPDGVATIHRHGDGLVSTSWSEWERRARVLAAGRVAAGVAPGERVA